VNWKSAKTGEPIRLPTEDEWLRIRSLLPTDVTNWKFGTAGNINLEKWASSCPVNIFETSGFFDIVGNVW